MSNRYNSIVETMKGSITALSQPLSAYGSAGATVGLETTDFATSSILYGTGASGSYAKFNISDIPAIKSFGIFCSLGDGLAVDGNLYVQLEWVAVDAGGAPIGTSMATLYLTTIILNSYEESEYFPLFTTPAAMASLAANIVLGATHTQLRMTVPGPMGPVWNFGAYSMATPWNAASLLFWPQFVVEHTYPLEI